MSPAKYQARTLACRLVPVLESKIGAPYGLSENQNTRWCWAFRSSSTDQEGFLADTSDLKDFDDWQLRGGKSIENWSPDSWMRCTDP